MKNKKKNTHFFLAECEEFDCRAFIKICLKNPYTSRLFTKRNNNKLNSLFIILFFIS